jgi:hypothetical protein
MKKDLVVLSADRSAQGLISEVLKRFPIILGVRPFSWEVMVHDEKDPGCYTYGVQELNNYTKDFSYCILIFDHEGSGAEDKTIEEIESGLEGKLNKGLWIDRNAVIVIEPELENWIWTNSPHTSNALGWGNEPEELNHWLIAQKWLSPSASKPARPKEAMQAAMRTRIPISSATFESIGRRASFKSCTSRSFLKFKDTITNWFQHP